MTTREVAKWEYRELHAIEALGALRRFVRAERLLHPNGPEWDVLLRVEREIDARVMEHYENLGGAA